MKNRRGQTAMEYLAMVTLLLGVWVAISSYYQRGVAGRWKMAVDDLGDQYDPRVADVDIVHTISSNTDVRITTIPAVNGAWTLRTDITNTIETQDGDIRIDSY